MTCQKRLCDDVGIFTGAQQPAHVSRDNIGAWQADVQAANSKLWRGRDLANSTASLPHMAEGGSAAQQGRQLRASTAEELEVKLKYPHTHASTQWALYVWDVPYLV